MEYWGKHLLIDGRTKNIEKIQDKENVANFVNELIEKIDMVKYGPLWIEYFATHDPDKAGLSFFQMIETSNVSGHLVDKDGTFYIDVFSCKDFETHDVVVVVQKYFGADVELYFHLKHRDANKVFDEIDD